MRVGREQEPLGPEAEPRRGRGPAPEAESAVQGWAGRGAGGLRGGSLPPSRSGLPLTGRILVQTLD